MTNTVKKIDFMEVRTIRNQQNIPTPVHCFIKPSWAAGIHGLDSLEETFE